MRKDCFQMNSCVFMYFLHLLSLNHEFYHSHYILCKYDNFFNWTVMYNKESLKSFEFDSLEWMDFQIALLIMDQSEVVINNRPLGVRKPSFRSTCLELLG